MFRTCFFVLVVVIFCSTEISAWRRRRRNPCSNTPCQWHWSECSKTCGGGTQYPIKTVNQGSCGSCDMPSETQACNTKCCKLDCSWNTWGNWGTCSNTCGGGIQLRSRGYYGPSCGGTDCEGVTEEQRECNSQCCPVDCRWTSWEPIDSCSTTCGGGLQLRNRTEEILPSCNGDNCTGTSSGSIACNTQCCAVDCVWQAWGSWSVCSKTCNGGNRTRVRNIDTQSTCGGRPCNEPASEQEICNSQCCVIDCVWGEWNSWSSCTKSCGIGVEARERIVQTQAECGGSDCTGDVCVNRPCNEFCCPSQCEYSTWTQWSACDQTCDTGSQWRQREVSIDGSCVAQKCLDPVYEDRQCNTQCCPVDCVLTQWSPWSECSTSCGSEGVQYRHRTVEQQPECGGVPCEPDQTEEIPCNRICLRKGSMMTDYGCVCGDGWRGECCGLDINECDFVNCTDHSTCMNSQGSYECVCNHNYTREGDLCLHYDKCATERHDCHEQAECTMQNKQEYVCKCYPGFEGNGFTCTDVNECVVPEESGQSGEYEETSGEMVEISDEGYPICNIDATCINTYGNFYCQCNDGFTGDGYNCTDFDECVFGNFSNGLAVCSEHANCNNTFGSYFCWCKPGYFGDGKQCQEINECASDPCQNDGLCVDKINDLACQCKPGYEGPTCVADINECENEISTCDKDGICFNLPGSYACECKTGFEGNGLNCTDIDECSLGTDDCEGVFSLCRNVPGRYVCECEPGTGRDDNLKKESG